MKVNFPQLNFNKSNKKIIKNNFVNTKVKPDTVDLSSTKSKKLDKELNVFDYISTIGFLLKIGFEVLGVIALIKYAPKITNKFKNLKMK